MDGYYGRIDDVDLALIRGAYNVDGLYINKVDTVSREQTRFFRAASIDLSIEWNALFHGALVGELVFIEPELHFTREKAELKTVVEDSADFRKLLRETMPLRINRFAVENGNLHYVDPTSDPRVDVAFTEIYAVARNLKSIRDNNQPLPASISGKAQAHGGFMKFSMRLDPLADTATFDMNLEIENTDLARLNDFFMAYGRFDVSRGTFSMYTEMAARDGEFAGYLKPLIVDLDVKGEEDREDSFLRRLWESAVGTVGKLLSNPERKQLATKVSMRGSFHDPNISALEAVFNVLRNAFIEAMLPRIDHEITIGSVATKQKARPDGPQ
jgi:hypothetical protein